MNDYWCIPPKENAEFVAHMEDILDIYEMPYNPELPVVCMDEKPYQCIGETCEPLPMRPGDNQKTDSEYVREGTCSIFVFTEPLRGWRHSSVRKTRTALDWAGEIKYLLTECYPNHSEESLYIDDYKPEADGAGEQGFTSFLVDRSGENNDKWTICNLKKLIDFVEDL